MLVSYSNPPSKYVFITIVSIWLLVKFGDKIYDRRNATFCVYKKKSSVVEISLKMYS